MHRWTESDDLMVFFLYKFGKENSPITKDEISKKIGVSLGSLSYRIGNFKAINGEGNATHFAKLSEMVFKKYAKLNMQELKNVAFTV